ncbi:MAG: AEC family transporter [Kordiimonadaceae bacterium]|nr:AEC family transporter [Kordiimonadaceae bacterium]
MVEISYIVAPIFLIILLGKLLKVSLIKDDGIWNQINKLTYWVLFPCLLFNKTSVIDFEGFSVGGFSASLMTGYLVAVLVGYILSKMYGMSAASLSSVIQGSGRHNSFVALAVVSQLLGEQGELIGTIAIAIMVIFSNVLTIVFMTSILADEAKRKPNIFTEILKNPFIVSIAIGLSFNFIGWGNLPVLHDFTDNIGRAGLPLALICVGAGLKFVGVRNFLVPTFIASLSKMVILPFIVFLSCVYFDLAPIMTMCAVIFATVPTSSTAYALAKYMGGDAPLMAAIISLQTLLAVITIPLVIILLS